MKLCCVCLGGQPGAWRILSTYLSPYCCWCCNSRPSPRRRPSTAHTRASRASRASRAARASRGGWLAQLAQFLIGPSDEATTAGQDFSSGQRLVCDYSENENDDGDEGDDSTMYSEELDDDDDDNGLSPSMYSMYGDLDEDALGAIHFR